jgi:ribosomal protein S6--L-glutamate ligase
LTALRIGLVGTPELVTFPRYEEALTARGVDVVQIDPMDLVAMVAGTDRDIFMPHVELDALDAFFSPVAGAASSVMLSALRILEERGLPTINRVAGRALARDKWGTAETLVRAGIPQPRTLFVGGSGLAADSRQRAALALGYPLVVKGRLGSRGDEVLLARSEDELESIVAGLGVPLDDGVLLQEFFAEAGGRDVRVIVLDGRILAVKSRWSGREDEFRAAMPGYVAGIGELIDLEAAMCLAAATAIGLDYTGVDLIRTSKGPMILELNGNPFLATTERVTNIDIAGAVADALIGRIRGAATA